MLDRRYWKWSVETFRKLFWHLFHFRIGNIDDSHFESENIFVCINKSDQYQNCESIKLIFNISTKFSTVIFVIKFRKIFATFKIFMFIPTYHSWQISIQKYSMHVNEQNENEKNSQHSLHIESFPFISYFHYCISLPNYFSFEPKDIHLFSSLVRTLNAECNKIMQVVHSHSHHMFPDISSVAEKINKQIVERNIEEIYSFSLLLDVVHVHQMYLKWGMIFGRMI